MTTLPCPHPADTCIDIDIDISTPAPSPASIANSLMMPAEYEKLRSSSPQVYEFIRHAFNQQNLSIVVTIPTHQIRVSSYANREVSEFRGEDFLRLRASIEQSHGNSTPAIVRVISTLTLSGVAAESPLYELVAGHRRLQVCRELGLSLKVIVVPAMSDAELFLLLHNENAERTRPCPYAEGKTFNRALEQGFFKTQAHLAKSLARDAGDVSRAIALAELPEWLTIAFQSPADLQFHDAKILTDAHKLNPVRFRAAAENLADTGAPRARAHVIRTLLDAVSEKPEIGSSNPSKKRDIKVKDRQVATARWDKENRGQIKILVDIPDERKAEFENAIAKAIARVLQTTSARVPAKR